MYMMYNRHDDLHIKSAKLFADNIKYMIDTLTIGCSDIYLCILITIVGTGFSNIST